LPSEPKATAKLLVSDYKSHDKAITNRSQSQRRANVELWKSCTKAIVKRLHSYRRKIAKRLLSGCWAVAERLHCYCKATTNRLQSDWKAMQIEHKESEDQAKSDDKAITKRL
jgi:hypothetical protein